MIKVAHLLYGRLRAPDLDAQEAFLSDFGMVRSARTERALYMRGTGPAHHIHVTELGETGTVGIAFAVTDEGALETASKIDGASGIEAIDEPGGGRRVRLTDPNGYQVEVVHGLAALPELPVRENFVNTGIEPERRLGTLTRLPKGPSQVRRLGHAVFASANFEATVAWYRRNLGMIGSDDIYAGDKSNLILSFNRCDRGELHVDHHSLMCIKKEHTGLNHLAFEVQDMDDLFIGHEHLTAKGYDHMWGLGRHVLGSQCFDYWADPFGRVHEHWTDIDMLDASVPTNLLSAEEGLGSQWGEPAPERFINHYSP